MTEDFNYCASFEFDGSKRQCCLELFELGQDEIELAKLLQEYVIRPNLTDIVDQFYDFMLSFDAFKQFLKSKALIKSLRQTQADYLRSFGVDFTSKHYFEERLRVGMAHKRIGLPISLYQAAYRKLQQTLVDVIPADIDSHSTSREAMIDLIGKLTALDMSLAIETYYLAYVQEVQASLTELRLEGDELRNMVSMDAMTGVHSRDYILGLLERGMSVTLEKKKSLCVAMLDLDNFKQVNDTYGHLVGDKVLQRVAEIMSDALRDGDFVGRYGGEEFLIVLCGTPLKDAEKVIDRLRQLIASKPVVLEGGNKVDISLSAGVSERQRDDSMESLIDRADAALYIAKDSGRNRVVVK